MNHKILILIVTILVIAGIYWVSKQGAEMPSDTNNIDNTVISDPIKLATKDDSEYVVDPNGMTLYVNIKDEGQTIENMVASCDAECEQTWLPYILGENEPDIMGSSDTLLSKLNIFTRTDGRNQYSLGTTPLYRNVSDLKSGDMNGDVSEDWMVAKP